jgi:aflatoxin B1 aldehyde reductase
MPPACSEDTDMTLIPSDSLASTIDQNHIHHGFYSSIANEDRFWYAAIYRFLITIRLIPVGTGAMTIGKPGVEQARVHDLPTTTALLDEFQSHGHSEIDTASSYCEGSSETMLGQLDWQSRNLAMATKYYPTAGRAVPSSWDSTLRHTPAALRKNLTASLKALKTDKVDMWYLHAPDRTTPFAETFEAVDSLHREGLFARLGLSNYQAWEVAQICEICRSHGWKQPDVYQGVYNALHRAVEPELFACLRHYRISFYAYNPLAGGYLTDRYHRDTTGVEPGSRFDPDRFQGQAFRKRYWNEPYFDALERLRAVAGKHGLSEAECALRWLVHHSKLQSEKGDAVIVGASSVGHLEANLSDLEKEPLPKEVSDMLDEGWELCKAAASTYWH